MPTAASPVHSPWPPTAPAADLAAAWSEQLAQGNRQVVGEIFDRLGAGMYSLAHALLGEASSAAEVVEEVFAELWRHRGRFAAADTPATVWLLSRCRERALARKRGSPEGSGRPQPAAPGTATDAGVALLWGALQPYDPADQCRLAREALARVPSPLRVPLERAYFRGVPVAALARELDTTLEEADATLRRGLASFRDNLAALCTPGSPA